MNILLIEPDRLLAQNYYQFLTQAGHDVMVCATAQAAVLAADETRPDVIVLELQLVEHSGVEFLYEFRSYADWQSIPVIVQTHVPPGEFSLSWTILREQLGVVRYLYKPQTSLQALTDAVQSYAAAVHE
jgi:DNA-binding response OmpR family regulator